jgi:hypothetical protein
MRDEPNLGPFLPACVLLWICTDSEARQPRHSSFPPPGLFPSSPSVSIISPGSVPPSQLLAACRQCRSSSNLFSPRAALAAGLGLGSGGTCCGLGRDDGPTVRLPSVSVRASAFFGHWESGTILGAYCPRHVHVASQHSSTLRPITLAGGGAARQWSLVVVGTVLPERG